MWKSKSWRVLLGAFLLSLTTVLVPTGASAASNDVTVAVNEGSAVEFRNAPFLLNGSAYLPLRETGALLGSATTWISDGRRIVIQNPEMRIELALGSKQAKINGKTHELRVVPYNKNGTVYVPVRFVGEAFGATVKWDGKQRRVNLGFEAKYITAAEGPTVYWLNRQSGELYLAEQEEPVKQVADTNGEVLDIGEFTVDPLSEDVHVLKLHDNYGEPHIHDNIYKMVLVQDQLKLETKVYYGFQSIRTLDRSAEGNALLMDGAILYEVNPDGVIEAEHDLQEMTGYEDASFQVEWYDAEYMVVRPSTTGWLTLIDRETGATTKLMEELLTAEQVGIYESLDKLNTEFRDWDGLKVLGREGDALKLEHYYFVGGLTTEFSYDLAKR
ncbi:copper amine oxidase N-terminal domain-containing protein [Paenibacillus soyae]|uniref:Copper amine oxidase N-terminal domain-containing protein n=1 Tax=Paenibacillus soyae TaxID=2969249 RepID=A0A9X2SBM7_9BACL|nr:copper amine oxidase N-terminal domain-containing protein [Paenibacillus soyae]MCR2805808.1 copper amine oxidase N-terminal domain-containing protein [Paenibacillus soyae]